MPFQTTALSSTQLDKLRGTASVNPTYRTAKYLSLCPNTTVFAARVSSVPTGNSIQSLVYGSVTVGAYTDVIVDQRVLISHTTDRRAAFFDGRIQAAPSSTNLYINETSAAVAIGDYIFVVDDYPLKDKLARPVGTTQYKDYNVSFRRMLPYVKGLQTAYCGWIATPSDVSTKFRVAFSITAMAADSGASISSYLWTFPSSKTIISGSTTAAAVTVDFASSVGDWCHLKVTDSNGNYITRHFFVHAASDTYPPSSGFSGLQLSGGIDSGWSASCEAFSGVSSVLDRTFAVGWDQEYYNGTEGALLGGVAAVKFVGRFRQETISTQSHEVYSQIQGVRYSFEGPTEQLSSLESLPRALIPKASPAVWDEIKDLTLWRAIVYILSEHSTFLNLHDLSFDDTGTTFLTAQLGVTGGDIYRAVQDLAVSINAVFEFAPQGESRVIREAVYQTSGERNALPTVADFTSQDWINISIDTDPVTRVGKVPASGGTYNSTTVNETPLLALAPGLAQESGTDEPALTRQILTANATQATAQSELNTRAGHHFAKNNDQITLNVLHPDGYNFLVPSVGQWYTWTIAATDNARGLAYTTATRWRLISVSIEDDNEHGAKGGGVNATYVIETSGAAGTAIEYPAEGEITPYLPDIPAFGPYDLAFPEDPFWLDDAPLAEDIPPQSLGNDSLQIAKFNGQELVVWSTAAAYYLTNFLNSTSPTATDITPSDLGSYLIKQCVVDPFCNATRRAIPCYLLASDGTNSAVWYSANIAAGVVEWTKGADTSGVYTVIRATGTAGTIMMEGQGVTITSPCSSTSDFNGTNWSLSEHVGGFDPYGHFSGTTLVSENSGANGWYASASITIPSTNIDTIECDVYNTVPSDFVHVYFWSGASLIGVPTVPNQGLGWVHVVTGISYSAITKIQILIAGCAGATPPDCIAIRDFQYCSSGGIVTPGNATVVTSTDYGATFGTAEVAGTSTSGGVVGFDTQRSGNVSYAGYSGGVAKATSLGGSYSAWYTPASGDPVCVIVPYFRRNSTANNTAVSDPDTLVATATGKLYWVDGTAATATDISPSGVTAFSDPNCVTVSYGHHIACYGSVSGTYHLFTSTNGGTSWTDRGARTSPTFIRCRRNDTKGSVSGTNAGQIYLCDNSKIAYSKLWGSGGLVDRLMPVSGVIGLETIV